MKIYLTTDTHFSHKKIIEFGRPNNYENLIKKDLMFKISPTDILIHLGDIGLGGDAAANSQWFKNTLKCKTFLIKGNHDGKSYSWYLKNGWDFVCKKMTWKMFGKKICFSHIPIEDDNYFDLNIHGHIHDGGDYHDDEIGHLRDDKHHLIALELNNYKVVDLQKLIENYERSKELK